MAWYDEYFKENYFLLEEPSDLDTIVHINFIKSFLDQLPPEAGILDLASGSGRLSFAMSRLNFHVTGLEYIDELVEHAKNKAREYGLDTKFVKADMKDIPFEGTFDFVLNFGHSFGYFIDDRENAAVLAQMFKSLKPGGSCLVDLANKESLVHGFEAFQRRWVQKDKKFILFRREFDPLTGRLNTHVHLMGENLLPQEYLTSVRYYTYPELKRMLLDAGFTILQVFGGYDKAPYVLGSPRMIVLAQKPE